MEFEIKDGLMEFSDKKVVGVAKVEIGLTENDIENIMVTALEGGIGYWACLNNTGDKWEDKPKLVPSSQWATKLLLEGKSVQLIDEEEEKKLSLTLEMLIKGFAQNFKERPWDNDINNGDSITASCIIQYALFNELVYG